LSETRLKVGVFVGPDIRKLMFDEDFLLTMTEVEREAWIALRSVVTNFLGNNKDPDYVTTVANMLEKVKVLGCLMSLKINFLNLHLDFSPKILAQLVRSKENVSTKTLRKWKEDTRVSRMLTSWVTTAGRYIMKFQKPHIRGRATYAALPARKKDSTRPLNKI
jgi:low temperature requirement protein LtrA